MLQPILDSTRARLPEIAQRVEQHSGPEVALEGRGFRAALEQGSPGVIAEVKRRSPSAGDINPDLDPVALASSYADGGAAGISVLTEPDHFGGSMADLTAVATEVGLPVLCKDFILDPVQIVEARLAGAAAVLLIASILQDAALRGLLDAAGDNGLDALVEVHDETELERAISAGASIVGINNRDLRTFHVDLETAVGLAELIPKHVVGVAESGVHGREDAQRMFAAGFEAVLVGQAAAQSDDPAAFVRSLTSP